MINQEEMVYRGYWQRRMARSLTRHYFNTCPAVSEAAADEDALVSQLTKKRSEEGRYSSCNRTLTLSRGKVGYEVLSIQKLHSKLQTLG